MSKREVIAYAITHAPPGVKGGPYEAESGPPGEECDSLRDACRWPTTEADARVCAVMYLEDHLSWCGDARVIRIVRARPSPSEPSAVEVLRELVASHDDAHCPLDRIGLVDPSLIDRARRVLAAAGPDPSEVVRAAMAEEDARVRMVRASYAELRSLEGDWLRCTEATRVAVDAYRKAGGK